MSVSIFKLRNYFAIFTIYFQVLNKIYKYKFIQISENTLYTTVLFRRFVNCLHHFLSFVLYLHQSTLSLFYFSFLLQLNLHVPYIWRQHIENIWLKRLSKRFSHFRVINSSRQGISFLAKLSPF